MPGLGTLINMAAVAVGSSIGAVFGERLSERIRHSVVNAIGLVVVVIGISYGLETKNILIPLFAILIGTLIGEIIDIENYLEKFAVGIEKRFKVKEATFVEGFIAATLLFCVGPMSILGSIEDGLRANYEILALKSVLDGFAGMALAASLGWGVVLSVISIFLYQGSLTLVGVALGSVFTEAMIGEMTAVGGFLILGIGLQLLKIRENLRLGNMIPGLFIAPLIVYLLTLAGINY